MTADELLRLPGDGFRYELLRGELRKMSPAGARHSITTARIAASLSQHVKANGLGEVTGPDGGYFIAKNPDTVLAPDVGLIRNERVIDTDDFIDGPPDVAFEVISPDDTYLDVDDQIEEWLRAGTGAVVVVDPRRKTVRVHGGVSEITDVVPGWRMPFGEIFR